MFWSKEIRNQNQVHGWPQYTYFLGAIPVTDLTLPLFHFFLQTLTLKHNIIIHNEYTSFDIFKFILNPREYRNKIKEIYYSLLNVIFFLYFVPQASEPSMDFNIGKLIFLFYFPQVNKPSCSSTLPDILDPTLRPNKHYDLVHRDDNKLSPKYV